MNNYTPKNLLITGGAGFIGANFIRYYLQKYPQSLIINLDLLTYAGSLENLKHLPHPSQYHFIQGDICDTALVAKILRDFTIDTIVHFAAESHVDRSISAPDRFIQTNIVGTFNLLEQARIYWLQEKNLNANTCRFHHISTDEVYGSLTAAEVAFTESTAYAPNSPYSASKASADHLVRAYFHTYQLPMTYSNCSNNYGRYQHAEKLIPTIIRCCQQQKPIPIYGNGANIRDWLYVDDHCHAIDIILNQGKIGENYNIGANNEINNLSLAQTICQLFDERVPQHAPHNKLITFVTDRPGHDWRYAIDSSKMKQAFNWQPQFSFLTALNKTLDFYISHD